MGMDKISKVCLRFDNLDDVVFFTKKSLMAESSNRGSKDRTCDRRLVMLVLQLTSRN